MDNAESAFESSFSLEAPTSATLAIIAKVCARQDVLHISRDMPDIDTAYTHLLV
jgi:hypothetical protein